MGCRAEAPGWTKGAALNPRRVAVCLTLALLLAAPAVAYVINGWWNDGDNIVVVNAFLPSGTWGAPAEYQLAKWNEIDGADLSHPFRISSSPDLTFRLGDGRNTMGFLGLIALKDRYELSYVDAVAWTSCIEGLTTPRYQECDMMLDPALSWSLSPSAGAWFQSVVLHEAGHARGLGHYSGWLSAMNTRVSFLLKGDQLYMDDFAGMRAHSSTVAERDIAIYNKWHDGLNPRWMTMGPTTVREGQTLSFSGISVENRGSLPFTTPVPFKIVLANTPSLTPPLTVVSEGSFSSFGVFVKTVFDWSATIPKMPDCVVRYVGAIIPSDPAWTERFEQNNAAVFSNGTYDPTPIQINLAPELGEPNESAVAATLIPAEYFGTGLSLDRDADVDYYQFTLSSFQRVLIILLSDGSLGNIDLMLLNGSEIPLASSLGTTGTERIEFGLPAGSYYIKVVGFGAGACNRYTLRLATGDCLNDADCDNGTYCSNQECGPSRTCVPAPNPCNDGNLCTLDLCSESRGGDCAHLPDPGAGADLDHDGICAAGDNCAGIYNPGQQDADGDGLGDPCDSDDDGDGVPDAADCSPYHSGFRDSPMPVTDLDLDSSSSSTMSWRSQSQDAGPATVYDIVAGAGANQGSWSCLAENVSGSGVPVAAVPPPGTAIYLLVRAINGCAGGVGSFGEANALPGGLAAQLDVSSPCSGALCGDAAVNQGEQCDDGNTSNADLCVSSCMSATCGDGFLLINVEQCDDGNTAGGDGCSALCVREAACGNGVLEPGERCDNGALNSDTTPDACRTTCLLARCGDGVTDNGESCDDGNTFGQDRCSANCMVEPYCGDRIPGQNEQCDDGNNDAGDGCSPVCIGEICGNGIADPGEQCDDGNLQGGDGCSPNCAREVICGNGVPDPGEACDDGNLQGGDGCSPVCQRETTCGDGIVEPGEQCDNGVWNSDFIPDSCRSSCVPAHCGDTVTDTGERCDDGNLQGGDGCSPICTFEAVCGNGFTEPGEQCDDGNTLDGDGCSSTCTLGICGNGIPEQGELCDNGALNSDTTPDACRTTCLPAHCGDDVRDTWEQCDDGNLSGGDGCSSQCTMETVCGNQIPEPGEECDDGNTTNGDGCSAICTVE